MRVNNTPQIDATGKYVLTAPFAAVVGKVYRCEAIEGFNTLEEDNVDVFQVYYEPFGLNSTIYEEDKLNGINIVTLVSDSSPTIHVPSSYITSFPNETSVPYSQTILSVDLGILPNGVDLDETIDAIRSYVSEVTGVPENGEGSLDVQLHLLSITDEISYQDHEALENNRIANIDASGREAQFVTIRRQADEIDRLNTKVAALEAVIIQLQA